MIDAGKPLVQQVRQLLIAAGLTAEEAEAVIEILGTELRRAKAGKFGDSERRALCERIALFLTRKQIGSDETTTEFKKRYEFNLALILAVFTAAIIEGLKTFASIIGEIPSPKGGRQSMVAHSMEGHYLNNSNDDEFEIRLDLREREALIIIIRYFLIARCDSLPRRRIMPIAFRRYLMRLEHELARNDISHRFYSLRKSLKSALTDELYLRECPEYIREATCIAFGIVNDANGMILTRLFPTYSRGRFEYELGRDGSVRQIFWHHRAQPIGDGKYQHWIGQGALQLHHPASFHMYMPVPVENPGGRVEEFWGRIGSARMYIYLLGVGNYSGVPIFGFFPEDVFSSDRDCAGILSGKSYQDWRPDDGISSKFVFSVKSDEKVIASLIGHVGVFRKDDLEREHGLQFPHIKSLLDGLCKRHYDPISIP